MPICIWYEYLKKNTKGIFTNFSKNGVELKKL